MKRELRALEAETLRLEQEASEAQAALETTQSARQDAERGLEEITAQQVEMGKATVVATLERDSARAELARLGMELAACQNEIERIRREAQSAQQQSGVRRGRARGGRAHALGRRTGTE